MIIRLLQLKKVLCTALFVLLLNTVGMTKMYAYDFSAVCPSGQTLYYNIIDSINHYVELACPCSEFGSIGGQGMGYMPFWLSDSMGGTWSVPQPTGDVVLPETVEYYNETYMLTSIGNNAFINCTELTSIIIPSSVTAIGSGAFYECSSLTSVVLPDSLVSIGASAFVWCTSLEFIEIPNTVTSIGDYAFSVSGITSMVIPTSVTTIGEELFAGCESLFSVELPSTMTFIDDHAFALCNNLTELIVFAETPPTLGNGVFYNAYESISVNVPCGKVSAYQDAMGWSQFINYQELLPYHLSITSSNPDKGTVQLIGEPDCEDATVVVGATANIGLGYAFTNWTENGEIVSTDNPFIFNLESDMNLVANFEEMQIYWRSYDFSAVCSSGQMLYYKITDSINHYVTMVFPIVSTTETGGAIWGDPIFDDYEPYWLRYSIDYTWSVPEPTGDVVLPETVEYNNESYTLTSIGGSAFVNCTELTSVTIPNSVTTIGREAFYGCSNLISIALPDSLASIDQSAFVWCTSLESIEIPNTVTFIGDFAFSVSGITSMLIPNSVTTIGEELFAACESLTSVVLPSTVSFIDDHAFALCNSLTELIVFAETPPTLGNGVYYHGYYTNYIKSVFVPCGYEDVYASVSWGGLNNFYGMCGGTVTVVADPEEGGTATGGGVIEEGSFCMVTAVSNEGYTFEYWELSDGTVVSNAVNYTFIVSNDMALVAHFISNDNIAFSDANVKSICINHWDSDNDGELSYEEAASVTDLGSYFQSNSQITSFNELQYFTGLSFIGNAAFKNCTRLSSIVLPNSLTSIGDYAFYYCSKLTGSLTIPNSVTSIGSFAFYGCSRMTGSLTLPISVTTIGDYVFSHCSSLKGSLIIPNSVTSIGSSAFSDCSGFAGSLIIPNSVTSIGGSAFSGCSGFTGSLVIPNSVTLIGSSAFYYCCSFDAIIVETGNTVYDSRENGNALIVTSTNELILGCKNSIIPNSVTTLGDYAFYSCSGLTSIEIPNSVTLIGSSVFSSCSGLTSIEIPNSIISIDSYAFSGCNNLTSMTFLVDTPPALGYGVFSGVNKDIPVYVPCGTLEAYQNAIGWEEFANYIEMCEVSQAITLSEGWNWFSANVEITMDDLKEALQAFYPDASTSALIIKSKSDGQTMWNSTAQMWTGSLNAIDLSQMYMVKVPTNGEIILQGMPINPSDHPVTIKNGSNWIVFPLNESMSITDAFAGFSANGDIIKTKNDGQAIWNSNAGQWMGSLTTLEPGKGYIYNSKATENKIFVFPIGRQ